MDEGNRTGFGVKDFLGGPLYRGAVSPPRNPAHPCTPLHRLSLKIRDIKTVELDSLKVPLRNLRRRSQEFLSGSKKSSKPAEKSTKATQSAPSQPQPQASASASVAPQITAADMNGTVSNGTAVPSYLLTGKVAVVTGSGKQ